MVESKVYEQIKREERPFAEIRIEVIIGMRKISHIYIMSEAEYKLYKSGGSQHLLERFDETVKLTRDAL